MPDEHLIHRSSGHLGRTTAGHLARSCKATGGGGCTTICDVTPDPTVCWRSDPITHALIADATPDSIEVTITAWMAGRCDFDTAAPYHVFATDIAGLVGVAFCLPYSAGGYSKFFNVTGAAKLLRCYGSAPNDCTKCTPTTDISTEARLTISVGAAGGSPSFRIELKSSDGEWSPPDTWRDAVISGLAGATNSFTDCCTAYSISGGTYNPVEAAPSAIVTAVSLVPCC